MGRYRHGIWLACVLIGVTPQLSLSGNEAEFASGSQTTFGISWDRLPDLPPAEGQSDQLGLAGPYVGVHHDTLIVAGGANFPHGAPWDSAQTSVPRSGKKIYWDEIYALAFNPADANSGWRQSASRLPRPMGYGVAISTEYGIVCIGGESKPFSVDETGNQTQRMERFADVYVIAWDPTSEQATISRQISRNGTSTALPRLPSPLTGHAGALVENTIYIAGGDLGEGATNTFWALDLNAKALLWKQLPSWPGPPRVLPIAATQNDGIEDCFYLLSGRNTSNGNPSVLLRDAYRYSPTKRRWKRLADAPRCLMAGTGIGVGVHHILAIGGDDGTIFTQLERLAPDNDSIAAIQRTHPGFNRDILAYHTITDTWTNHPESLPVNASHVTTNVVKWRDQLVIPTGEIRPAVRTPSVLSGTIERSTAFGTLNYIVLVSYLAALVLMGVWFSQRMHDAEDFFKAGQRIPWWAAGLSIFGTQLSAITFMAIPAKTYSSDWRLLIANLTIVAVAPFVVLYFLPFYRRLHVTTAYEYLELRFNRPIRQLASGMFILLQFGRIGVVLLLPSIALSVVTGIDVTICILSMGVLCILYTVLGGIEAVIWTDVLQVVVLIGGALLCLVLIPNRLAGGWNEMIEIGESANRFRLLDFRWNWQEPTFFVILLGAFSQNLISYGSDQAVIQRYLTTKDEETARQSIWTAAILAIPASLLFFMMGTALFAYFKTHPGELDPGLQQADAIFPHFIVHCLPSGVAGLVIAAVFAAAMSSLDSSMNSVAAAVTADFYRRSQRRGNSELTVARLVTVLVGVAGTAFAIWMSRQPDIKSLWDAFARYIGLFGGGLCGLFLLAIFTQRTSPVAAFVGLFSSGCVQFALNRAAVINPWLYSATGIITCCVIGYAVAGLFPEKRKITGLSLASATDGSCEPD